MSKIKIQIRSNSQFFFFHFFHITLVNIVISTICKYWSLKVSSLKPIIVSSRTLAIDKSRVYAFQSLLTPHASRLEIKRSRGRGSRVIEEAQDLRQTIERGIFSSSKGKDKDTVKSGFATRREAARLFLKALDKRTRCSLGEKVSTLPPNTPTLFFFLYSMISSKNVWSNRFNILFLRKFGIKRKYNSN